MVLTRLTVLNKRKINYKKLYCILKFFCPAYMSLSLCKPTSCFGKFLHFSLLRSPHVNKKSFSQYNVHFGSFINIFWKFKFLDFRYCFANSLFLLSSSSFVNYLNLLIYTNYVNFFSLLLKNFVLFRSLGVKFSKSTCFLKVIFLVRK